MQFLIIPDIEANKPASVGTTLTLANAF